MTLSTRQKRKLLENEIAITKKRFEKARRKNLFATPGPHDCILVLDQLKPDFNIGKIFRSADAFGVREIHLIGIEYFNPSSAKGSMRWVPAKFYDSLEQSLEQLEKEHYTLHALDPEQGQELPNASLPKKSAFILGHEEFGLSTTVKTLPDINCLKIPQFGQVQSLNVSIAASIVLYEYVRQN